MPRRAPSLFKLIDSEGALRGNDENLLRKMKKHYLEQTEHPNFKKPGKIETPQFMIEHYAGDVVYDIAGFTEKNKDLLSDHLMDTLQSTSHSLMQVLFPMPEGKAPVRRGNKITGFSVSSQFKE